MPDIFDDIASNSAPAKGGDIFDQISPSKVPTSIPPELEAYGEALAEGKQPVRGVERPVFDRGKIRLEKPQSPVQGDVFDQIKAERPVPVLERGREPNFWEKTSDFIKDPFSSFKGTMNPSDIAESQIKLEAREKGLPVERYVERYIDTVNPHGSPLRRVEQFNKGIVRGAVGTVEGMAGSAEWLTDGVMGKNLANQARLWQSELTPDEVGFSDELASGVGSMLTFFVPGIGIVKGANNVAKVAPRLASWMGSGTATALEATTEAGQVYRDMLGKSKDTAKAESAALDAFWKNLVLVGATNKLGVFSDKGGVLRRGATSAVMEGGQEMGQEVISTRALEEPLNPKQILTAGAIGAITGGGFGAAGAKLNPEAKPEPSSFNEPVLKRPETKTQVEAEEDDVPISWPRKPEQEAVQSHSAIVRGEDVDALLKEELNQKTTQPVGTAAIPSGTEGLASPEVKPMETIRESAPVDKTLPSSEDIWGKTSADIEKGWNAAQEQVQTRKAEAAPKIKEIEAELKKLKKKRGYEDVKRRKELEGDLTRLRRSLSEAEGEFEASVDAEEARLRTEVIARAKARGVEEKDLEGFADSFFFEIDPKNEDYDSKLKLSDIFDRVLSYYTTGEEVGVDGQEKRQEGREGLLKTAEAPKTDIDVAAHEAATSPLNDLPEPTEAQKSAGNYKKGHVNYQGLDITIENPKGSERSGTAPDGRKWSTTMQHHYGYVKRTEGKDGDQVDVFIGENQDSDKVFVVNQIDPKTGKFDEHKALLGFESEEAAREGYLSNYEKGWKGLGSMAEMSAEEFKTWVREGNTKKSIKTEAAQPAAVEELKFVWRRNKEGGQKIGNLQIIRPVNEDIFIKEVLPRTKEGFYKGKTSREQYDDFKKRMPDYRASYIDTGYGLNLIKIDKLDSLLADIKKKEELGWVKQVDDFESQEAKSFRNVADSDLKEKKRQNQKSAGKTVTIKTERGTAVQAAFAVVEASDLITSHDTSLSKNEDYPQELQPRERERAASELQINRILTSLEPEFLGESPKASEGAPIVGPDMVVESGNGRTIALIKGYESGHERMTAYKDWLKANSEKFGLDPKTLDDFKTPVLVRVRQSDIDRVKFVHEANEQSVAAMSASEQAKADAESLTGGLLSAFETNDAGEINTAANRHFIRAFLNKVVSSAEMGRYITSDGEISQEGIRRIRNAVFAKAYGDPVAIEKLAEATDTNIKQIMNAMVALGPKFAMLEESIRKGERHNLSIAPEIAQAAKKMSQLREAGQSFEDYLNQGALFDDGITALAKDVIGVFDFYKKSGKKIKEIFNNYVEAVDRLGSPKQESLFGEVVLPSKAEILQASIKKVEEDENVQTSLFQSAAVDGSKGPSAPEKGKERRAAEKSRQEVKTTPEKTSGTTGPLAPGKSEPLTLTKEPWEMTLTEYYKEAQKSRAITIGDLSSLMKEHQAFIEDALSKGKVIPAQVLKDYSEYVAEKPSTIQDHEPKVKESKKSPSKSPQTPQNIIEDVGEKFGGARKDRWRERGLALSDLEGMTPGEEYAFVAKDEVWPKIDYKALVEGGTDPLLARALKHVRDGIPSRPDRDTAEYRRAYVEMVGRIRDAIKEVKSIDDLRGKGLYNRVTEDIYEKTEYSQKLIQAKAVLLHSIGRKGQKALQISSWDLSRMKSEIEETGWPLQKSEKARKKDDKQLPERPYLEHVKRTGEDYRSGKDITADDFVEVYGFRGVEFGNWVNQEERQTNINMAFDALMELAEVLKIPPKALSLDSTLGLAFGSRGGGRFAAHYEPGRAVINLTKIRGAGALAHEYAHALDNYLGALDIDKGSSGKPTFSSGGRGAYSKNKLANLRPEIQEAFDGVMRAIFKRDKTRAEVVRDAELQLEKIQADITRVKGYIEKHKDDKSMKSYLKNWREWLAFAPTNQKALEKRLAEARDENYKPSSSVNSSYLSEAQKLGEYWQRPTELFARAFEAYVFDKMGEQGLSDDYLVQGVEGERYTSSSYKGNPYPAGLERETINKAFDDFIAALETKPGKKSGSIAIFENLTQYHPEYKNDETNRRIAEVALDETGRFELSFGRRGDIDTDRGETEGGIRTLGVGITAELAQKGYIDLRGRKAETAHDIAVVAQVYRNPQYETVRYIYVKEGKVVAHEGRTSRLPGTALAFAKDAIKELYEIRQRMKRLGADGIWIVHNHPSGDPKPSRQDRDLTKVLAKNISGLKGHVIIDSNKYASLRLEGGDLLEDTVGMATDDGILKPYIDHPLLGAHVADKGTLAQIARALKTPSGFVVAVYRDAKGLIRAIQELPAAMANDKKALTDYLRGRAREFGTPSAFIAVPSLDDLTIEQEDVLVALTQEGTLQDTLFENKSVMETTGGGKAGASTWMGRPVKGMRVAEEVERSLLDILQTEAVPYVRKELTPENWTNEFGEKQTVKTPIGDVKLGKNQYIKLKSNRRDNYFGLIKPTLQEPLYVVEDEKKGTVFIKSFVDDKKTRYFVSVGYDIDGMKIIVSNHLKELDRVLGTIKNGRLLYTTDPAIHASVPASPKQPTVANGLPDGTSGDMEGVNPDRIYTQHPSGIQDEAGAEVSESNISPDVEEVNKVKEEEAPYTVNREIVKAPENPFRIKGAFNKFFHPLGLKDPDLSKIEALLSLPWWMGKRHEEYYNILDVELNRQARREQLLHRFLEKTKPVAKGEKDVHEFLALPKEQADDLFKVMIESDRDNKVYRSPEGHGDMNAPFLQQKARAILGKELTEKQVEAYYAWNTTMQKALSLIIDEAERLNYIPYDDFTWVGHLKSVIQGEKTLEQVDAELSLHEFKALEEALKKIRPFDKTIRRLRKQTGRIKYYVPRVRENGDYAVRVLSSKANTVWYEKAKTERQAADIKERLEKEFPGHQIEAKIEKQTPESLYQAVSEAAIERFIEDSISKFKKKVSIGGKSVNEMRDAMLEVVAEHLKARGFGSHMISRLKGTVIGGYQTENGQQIFTDYLSGMSGYITKQEAAYRFSQVLETVPLNKPVLFEEASGYVRDLLRNTTPLDRYSGMARSLAFTWFLAGNLKSAAVQLTQNFVTGIPKLSEHTKGATAKYLGAMQDVIRGKMSPEEAKALYEALDKGVASAQYIDEVTGQLKGKFERGWQKLIDTLSYPFRMAEVFNRKSAFLAMYRVARNEQKWDHTEAFKRARDFVFDTHYLMGKANLPSWARGATTAHAIGRTSYTFRSYTHNYLTSMIQSIAKQPDGKRHLGTLGRSLAWLMLFGGLTALPWLDDLLDLLERLTGTPYRSQVKRMLSGAGGAILEKVGTRGLPALLGVDLSGSIKIGLPSLGEPTENIYGVYGGLWNKAANSYDAFSSGQLLRGVESVSPAAGENLLKGYRMYTEGATNTRGKKLFDENGKLVELTPGEAIAQMAGFRPARVAAMSQEKQTLQNMKEYYAGWKEDIYTEFRTAKNGKERQTVLKDVQKYNREVLKFKGAIPKISVDALRNTMKDHPDKAFMRFDRAMDSD